ncbi:histidine triad (HIT) family protein [Anaerocolumna jejuensis DSM 15929]|uniref:Histidine triad (HIT) family protein n=1 Tax=Anaerocolumna jejuensis DSM 15929 TaxID=1121322 RepID=A0A1M6XVM4_9FIRM|nr:HIT family protein [Anaerocolumna jejuensis]SHL10024.1 histidine triad (HIT) family protein [Anaerocolumna jejuensis DSM 15929]
MINNCVFCSIIGHEIPSATIYEDEKVIAILDIAPSAKGHTVLIPKKHSKDIFELPEEDAAHIFTVAKKIAGVLKEELQCDGINILQNNGKAAGQTVFHLHVHIIPRYDNDTIKLTWTPGEYKEGEMQGLAETLARKVKEF